MSDFAFMRFMSNSLLTQEEIQHKDEIVDLTEQVFDAEGILFVINQKLLLSKYPSFRFVSTMNN
jgi:hypothetical protein